MIIGFDLETTSPHRGKHLMVHEARIIGFSVSYAANTGLYIAGVPEGLLKWALEDPSVTKVCHNSKFEYSVLKSHGINLVNFEDTKLAAYLLGYQNTSLKALARQLLGRDPVTYEQVTKGRDMSELAPEEIAEYAAADADNTRRLWLEYLEPELHERGLYGLYRSVEIPLVAVLSGMEARGIGVDEERTVRLKDTLGALKGEEEEVVKWLLGVDEVTNAKLSKALERLDAPIKRRTKVRNWVATDEDSLEEIRGWWPALVGTIVGKRGNPEKGEDNKIGGVKGLEKLGSYLDQFLELRGPDGRLHTSFNQAGHWEEAGGEAKGSPKTGRLSSSGPNLQQVPHHVAERMSTEIRKCLIPRAGWMFVSADVEQEEPRIVALVAKEEHMLQDFAEGIPIYAPMGEAIYGYPITKAGNPHEWFVAKTFFLAAIYGANWTKLKEIDPKLSVGAAKLGWMRLHEMYPRLKQFSQETIEEAKQGHVTDWFGRIRWTPKVWSTDRKLREAGYREAINMKVQGPAATVMKMMLTRLSEKLDDMGGKLLLTVHDEVVIECPEVEVDKVAELCYNATEGILPIMLPMEVKVGKNWGEMSLWAR